MAVDAQGNVIFDLNDLSFTKNAASNKSSLFSNQFDSTTSKPSIFNSNAQNQQLNYSSTPKKDTKAPSNTWAQGLNAITGAVGAYTAFQQLELGKKQFGFAKDSFNLNSLNFTKDYNSKSHAQNVSRTASLGLAYGTAAHDAEVAKRDKRTQLDYKKV